MKLQNCEIDQLICKLEIKRE